jgi:hypothetical protein
MVLLGRPQHDERFGREGWRKVCRKIRQQFAREGLLGIFVQNRQQFGREGDGWWRVGTERKFCQLRTSNPSGQAKSWNWTEIGRPGMAIGEGGRRGPVWVLETPPAQLARVPACA